MIRFRHCVLLLAGLALGPGPAAVCAQVETAKPIKLKAPKRKIEKFKGEVLSATSLQLVVRSRENAAVVKTFQYSPEVKEQMQKIIDRGGYQHGDKVEVHHEAGSDVALKIKGKPSKPQ